MSAIDMGAELGGRVLAYELPDRIEAAYRRHRLYREEAQANECLGDIPRQVGRALKIC